jgi:hypothetical protein
MNFISISEARKSILLALISLLLICHFSIVQSQHLQTDTIHRNDIVKAIEALGLPTIDGYGTDGCWDSATWYPINMVWMVQKTPGADAVTAPNGATLDSSDFYGRYKIMWSAKSNLLYVLAEITDNIRVDGFQMGQSGPGYPDYDVLEVFLDENHSGGLHVFDGSCDDVNNGNCLGTNAENAFSYHITVPATPLDGEVTTDKIVCDIAGTSWTNEIIENYANHLPEFTMRKEGNKYIYEFSLKVYKDTYNPAAPNDNTLSSLQIGKELGLAVAYCDDDTPGAPKRKSFIGSVYQESAYRNSCWENSTYYGTMQLMQADTVPVINAITNPSKQKESSNVWANPTTKSINLLISTKEYGPVVVKVYNMLGREIKSITFNKETESLYQEISCPEIEKGIYVVEVQQTNIHQVSKIKL